MPNIENARCDTGAVKAGLRFTPEYSRDLPETQYQPGSDECISRLHRALRAGRIARGSWGDVW